MIRAIFLAVISIGVSASPASTVDKYSSKNGKFAVEFPAESKPTDSIQNVDTPAGKVKMFMSALEINKDLAYLVSWSDYPEVVTKDKPQVILERVRDGTKGAAGKVLEDKEIRFGANKIPGRAYLLDKGGSYMRVRVYLSGARLYQVGVISTKKEDLTDRKAETFLDSFEIVK